MKQSHRDANIMYMHCYKTKWFHRASGRLGSMSESESAILNSVVTEEDEEGEQSRSESASSRHLLGER